MGRRGVCYDNAGAESFFATIKKELVDRSTWNRSDILQIHLFIWIETWFASKTAAGRPKDIVAVAKIGRLPGVASQSGLLKRLLRVG
jgi:hypothetical protein